VSTEATVHRRRFLDLGDVARNFGAVFADPKAVFGIKLGLAGILAVYISQLIRLDHANWALFTVLVLAPAQYVGAIAQRSIALVVGTIMGDSSVYGWSGITNKIVCFFWRSFSFTSVSTCTCLGARFSPTASFCALTLS
jgi:hypothetical protein